MPLVDLSVTINESTPVYPGDPKTKIEPRALLDKDGYEDHYVCVGTHVGTHVDAPSHMVSGGQTLNLIPPGRFTGRGIYIPVGRKFNLEKVKKANLRKGDIVLFHTGMSGVYHKPDYYNNYPAISEEIAKFLVGKKVKMVGVDMCSVDHEPFPVHKILLKKGILIIENLTNLKALKNKKFKVYAFPLKLVLDGSPTRVIAEIT